jgi:hypothetical protein
MFACLLSSSVNRLAQPITFCKILEMLLKSNRHPPQEKKKTNNKNDKQQQQHHNKKVWIFAHIL